MTAKRKPRAAGGSSAPTPAGQTAAPATGPTPVAEWGAQLYRLPSGRAAQLRRPALSAMLARGHLPNPIAAQLYRFLTDRTSDLPPSDAERRARYAENTEALLAVASLALAAPRLVLDRAPDAAADEIGPESMLDQDLLWIYYSFTLGDEDEVRPFRLA